DTCLLELIDSRIDSSGASSNCSLLSTVGSALVACAGGALVGGIAAIWIPGGPIAGAAVGCAGGAVGSGLSSAKACLMSGREANASGQALSQCRARAAACR